MIFQYTRANLKSAINSGIQGRIGMIFDQNQFVERVVRETKNAAALRSSRRRVQIDGGLFESFDRYPCPSDLHGYRIIDIPSQAKNSQDFTFVPTKQFRTMSRKGDVAIDDYNGIRTILLKSNVSNEMYTVPFSEDNVLESFGGAIDVRRDNFDFFDGQGATVFNISEESVGTAGFEQSNIKPFSLEKFINIDASVFLWVNILNAKGIQGVTVRVGNDNENYYELFSEKRQDNNVFQSGYNLVKFSFSQYETEGNPDVTNISYVSVFFNKETAKGNEQGYKVGNLVFLKGEPHEITYVSKSRWVNTKGQYKINATDDSDLLVCDEDDYDLFVKKGIVLGLHEVNADPNYIQLKEQEFDRSVQMYGMQNPDESQVMVTSYYDY